MKERRRYTRDFKLAAVKKVIEQGIPLAEVASDLGVADSLLYTWKRILLKEGAVKLGSPSSDAEEIRRLREENRRLKMERDVLKKATAFFANEKK